jgi:signal transduction histidine kinase
MQENRNFLKTLNSYIEESFNNNENNFFTLGWLFLVGFLGFYFFNIAVPVEEKTLYESVSMRAIIGFFGISLILYKYWSPYCKTISQYYWILGLTFALPFFFTFMLLMNQSATMWYVNEIVGILVLTLFVNWPLFFMCTSIGICSSLLAYYFNTGSIIILPNMISVIPSYIGSLIFFVLLMDNKNKIDKAKMVMVRALSYIIAHELRPPLATIKNCHYILNEDIEENYGTESSKNALRSIENTIYNTNLFIDILCKKTQNLNNKYFENIEHSIISAKEVIEESIKNYPNTYKDKITIENYIKDSCIIKSDYAMLTHIIYNLLDNSIFALKQKRKGGNILINSESNNKYIFITFRDNGLGIPKNKIKKIFECFYTDKRNGTGLGLYFCKTAMEAMDGNISCKSVEGEYTEFTLKFPKVSSKD